MMSIAMLLLFFFLYSMPVQRYVTKHFTSSYHYNTTSFVSNIEHHYITTAIVTQHWYGWKGGGQKSTIIVVLTQNCLISIVNVNLKKNSHHYCSYKYIRTCLSPLVLLKLGNEPIVPQQSYIRSPVRVGHLESNLSTY